MMFSGIVAVLDVPRMLLTVKNMAQALSSFRSFLRSSGLLEIPGSRAEFFGVSQV